MSYWILTTCNWILPTISLSGDIVANNIELYIQKIVLNYITNKIEFQLEIKQCLTIYHALQSLVRKSNRKHSEMHTDRFTKCKKMNLDPQKK
jgi:hypothetical protein